MEGLGVIFSWNDFQSTEIPFTCKRPKVEKIVSTSLESLLRDGSTYKYMSKKSKEGGEREKGRKRGRDIGERRKSRKRQRKKGRRGMEEEAGKGEMGKMKREYLMGKFAESSQYLLGIRGKNGVGSDFNEY